jgi:anti-sigma factor (TIGR02949 family)
VTAVPGRCDGTGGLGCSDVERLLEEYLDCEADAATCEAIRVHLDACPPCHDLAEVDRIVKSLVARACGCESPSADFQLRLVAELRRRSISVQMAFADRS